MSSDHPLIVQTEGVCGGAPRIAGRRITTSLIAILYGQRITIGEIVEEYGLTDAEVTAALRYEGFAV